jgi:hypothetical protein
MNPEAVSSKGGKRSRNPKTRNTDLSDIADIPREKIAGLIAKHAMRFGRTRPSEGSSTKVASDANPEQACVGLVDSRYNSRSGETGHATCTRPHC